MRSKSGHETLGSEQLRRRTSDMDASAKRAEMHGLTNRCSGRIVRLDGKRNEDMTASNALVTTVKQSGKPSGLMRTRTRSVSRHSRCPAHSGKGLV